MLCQGKIGDKSFHTRRILTFTAEFQNGTHQGLNLQKPKALPSIQQQAPFSLLAVKQGLLSVTYAAENPKISSLPTRQSFTQLKGSPLSALFPPHSHSLLPQVILLRP